MCDNHSNVLVEIPGASERGPHKKKRGIDGCIASLVEYLNQGGFATVASCCGHGRRPGTIILEDGRELWIVPDYETGRRLDKAFPDINGNDPPGINEL